MRVVLCFSPASVSRMPRRVRARPSAFRRVVDRRARDCPAPVPSAAGLASGWWRPAQTCSGAQAPSESCPRLSRRAHGGSPEKAP